MGYRVLRGLAADFGEVTNRDSLRKVDLFGKAGFGARHGTTADRTGRFALRAEIEAQFLSFSAGEHGRDADVADFISVGANWSF